MAVLRSGVSGDYDGLYFWLDEYEVLECGDSIATFLWESAGDIKTEIPVELRTMKYY